MVFFPEKSVLFFIQRIACPGNYLFVLRDVLVLLLLCHMTSLCLMAHSLLVLVIFGDKPYIKDPAHLDYVTNMFNSRMQKLKHFELFHTGVQSITAVLSSWCSSRKNTRIHNDTRFHSCATEGHHHLHLDTPERIFDKVCEFLLTPNDKLLPQLKRGLLGAWAQPQQEQQQRQQQLQPQARL